MPEGTPLFVRVDANGALAPYYEGHFHGQAGGNVSAVGIDARARIAGERTAPEYFPDYLTFSQPANPAAGRGPVPVAGIWGEYPDPVTPLAGVTPSLMVQAFGASSRVTRKLLDSAGNSDFLQSAALTPYAQKTDLPVFYQLARVGANTIYSPSGGTVGGSEVCRWNFTVPAGGTGMYGAMISGQGSTDTYGQRILDVLINEVLAGYMEGMFTNTDLNSYRTFTTSMAAYTTQRLTAGVTYLVRVITYAAGYAPYTDATDIYQGLMYRWAL